MTNSNDLARRVAALLSAPRYRPLPERELARALHLGSGQRGRLRQALRDLQRQGQAVSLGGGRWGPSSRQETPLTGTFNVRPNGSGWLMADGPRQPPFWVEPAGANSVLDGDRIQALPTPPDSSARLFGLRPDAKTVRLARILERKREWVVGVLKSAARHIYLVPRDPLLPRQIPLVDPPAAMKDRLGHLVVARLLVDVPVGSRPVRARFSEDLGDPASVANDIPALLLDRGLVEAFPDEVTQAAHRVRAPSAARHAERRERTDLRGQLIMAIDPATAHDHDDAVSIAPLPGNRWKLGVHIADVAAYVEPGSAIDREALRRGNSTYLVDRVVRMLPEDITVRVCSLRPGEDHLAHTVEIDYDAHGRVLETRTFRSLIRSRATLSYDQVQAFFDTGRLAGGSPEIQTALRQLRALAGKIRAGRFQNGALDFSLPEVHCRLDAAGQPVDFSKRGASEAYNLIEECMLAANQAVARQVHAARVPGIYRVHDAPSDDQWARMATELRALGQRTPPTDVGQLNGIVRAMAGKPEQYMVTLTLLRNMNRAIYAAECRPHFGLGFAHYAHFTSPIRRYPDLVLHRILVGIEEGRRTPVYSAAEIDRLAFHCSETERESAELESRSLQIKRIRYYADRLARGQTGPFRGTIVGLNPKGLLVEIEESLLQGMLPYRALGPDRFVLATNGYAATARTGTAFRLGQSLEVGLAAVDERLQRVDFFLPGAGVQTRGDKSVRQKSPEIARKIRHIGIDKPRAKAGNKPPYGAQPTARQRRPEK